MHLFFLKTENAGTIWLGISLKNVISFHACECLLHRHVFNSICDANWLEKRVFWLKSHKPKTILALQSKTILMKIISRYITKYIFCITFLTWIKTLNYMFSKHNEYVNKLVISLSKFQKVTSYAKLLVPPLSF